MDNDSGGGSTSQEKGVLLPVCVICEETPAQGIAGGMLVSGRFLCQRCEQEIVNAQVGDSHYALLKERIKRFWTSFGRG